MPQPVSVSQNESFSYVVQRSTTINADSERIYGQVADFHEWMKWSHRDGLDPDQKRAFIGSTPVQAPNTQHHRVRDQASEFRPFSRHREDARLRTLALKIMGRLPQRIDRADRLLRNCQCRRYRAWTVSQPTILEPSFSRPTMQAFRSQGWICVSWMSKRTTRSSRWSPFTSASRPRP